MPGLALLASPLVRGLLLAAALVAAVFAFGAYERHVGKAEATAAYEKAAQVEKDREVAVLEKNQQIFQQLNAALDKARSDRNATANQVRAGIRQALGNAGCLDAGSVRGIDRVR